MVVLLLERGKFVMKSIEISFPNLVRSMQGLEEAIWALYNVFIELTSCTLSNEFLDIFIHARPIKGYQDVS